MNPLYELMPLWVLFVVFFGFMGALGLVQARRKKENLYYFITIICFLAPLSFILIFLNQIVLGFVLMIAIGVLSAVALPKVLKLRVRQLQEVDVSAPLRRRDFLSDRMWLKLAQRWGVWKTIGIFSLFEATVIGG